MSVTAAQIQALPSGEFSAIADAVIEEYIAEAEARLDSGTWGDMYDTAVKYLTAHSLASEIAGGSGAAGPVVSETAGPVSRSYASPAQLIGDGLSSTVYGRKLIQMRVELGIMGFVA